MGLWEGSIGHIPTHLEPGDLHLSTFCTEKRADSPVEYLSIKPIQYNMGNIKGSIVIHALG